MEIDIHTYLENYEGSQGFDLVCVLDIHRSDW